MFWINAVLLVSTLPVCIFFWFVLVCWAYIGGLAFYFWNIEKWVLSSLVHFECLFDTLGDRAYRLFWSFISTLPPSSKYMVFKCLILFGFCLAFEEIPFLCACKWLIGVGLNFTLICFKGNVLLPFLSLVFCVVYFSDYGRQSLWTVSQSFAMPPWILFIICPG